MKLSAVPQSFATTRIYSERAEVKDVTFLHTLQRTAYFIAEGAEHQSGNFSRSLDAVQGAYDWCTRMGW